MHPTKGAANPDLWMQVGQAVQGRSVVVAGAESHVPGREVLLGYSSELLTLGNAAADALADVAVERVALPPEDVALLSGLLARTALVQKRLVRAAIAAAESTPPLPPRVQLGERPARGYVPVLGELGHVLLAKGARDVCTRCRSFAGARHRKAWVSLGRCAPATQGAPGDLVFLGSATAHRSHLLIWRGAPTKAGLGVWSCARCGLLCKSRMRALLQPCRPRAHAQARQGDAPQKTEPAPPRPAPAQRFCALLARVRAVAERASGPDPSRIGGLPAADTPDAAE